MRLRTALGAGFLGIVGVLGVLKAQKPFKEYPALEYNTFPLPPDYNQKAEWVRARLRYPDITGYPNRSRFVMRDGSPFAGYWTMDYPRSDRHLLQGVRRLTRIETRSVEQVVDLDGTDDIYNFPVVYGVEVGHWLLPNDQAAQLREYLLRGGFFICDDFHGSAEFDGLNEWETFMASLTKVFPDKPVDDIPNSDPIFHTLYDLEDRFQVPGAQYFETGITYERGESGKQPHWRSVRDDKGRIVAVINHNMDLGDAWEHSDEAQYMERWASLAYRLAMNYFIYDLTH
jgi:hypothetical protein